MNRRIGLIVRAIRNPSRILHYLRFPKELYYHFKPQKWEDLAVLSRLRTWKDRESAKTLRQCFMDGPGMFEVLTGFNREDCKSLKSELRDNEFYREFRAQLESLNQPNAKSSTSTIAGTLSTDALFTNGVSDVGLYLYAIVRALRPEIVVETGVANGESSAMILAAMDVNGVGHLTSIDLQGQELNQNFYRPEGKGVGWLVPDAYRDRWTLHAGDALELLPDVLVRLGHLDLFFHDSLHTTEHMLFEFHQAWKYLKPGGVLLFDDGMCPAFPLFMAQVKNVKGAIYHSFGGMVKVAVDDHSLA